MVLGQEEGQAKREEGGKEPVGSPWAVDGLDPPSAHAHQPSRHYFCWAWALGGVNGRSIIRRHRGVKVVVPVVVDTRTMISYNTSYPFILAKYK